MPDMSFLQRGDDARRLRLDTLIRLRWLAIAGQTIAVLTVYFVLSFPLHLGATLAVIALSACLNIALRTRYPLSHRVKEGAATVLLGYDILQLAVLLFLTGGLENPFAFLFLAPVLISATTLPPRFTQMLGVLAILCVTVLANWHEPLPWHPGENFQLPRQYVAGVWCAILLGLAFIGVYAWRVAEEARQLSDALAATEFVLAREQHLSVVDGLAAAAAHQLGTPLATIAIIINELDRAIASDSPHKDDILLLRQQSARCREILAKIASLGEDPSGLLDTLTLEHMLEEVVAPHRPFGVEISLTRGGHGEPPICTRNAGILYGLGNLIDNAVDFARSAVAIGASWTDREIRLKIRDDGPGFPGDILARMGEPYVTTRNFARGEPDERQHGGMGLGLFIAKTLLERSGAQFEASNALPPDQGAIVTITWPRAVFDARSVVTQKAPEANLSIAMAEKPFFESEADPVGAVERMPVRKLAALRPE